MSQLVLPIRLLVLIINAFNFVKNISRSRNYEEILRNVSKILRKIIKKCGEMLAYITIFLGP